MGRDERCLSITGLGNYYFLKHKPFYTTYFTFCGMEWVKNDRKGRDGTGRDRTGQDKTG